MERVYSHFTTERKGIVYNAVDYYQNGKWVGGRVIGFFRVKKLNER